MPFVAALFVRETQDFASLQADAIVVTDGKQHDGMLIKPKQRRKILRLYWGGCAICWSDEMPFVAALFVRETQNFASLLGGRHHYFV